MGRFLASLSLLLPLSGFAAPNEIKVFTDELANYGESTLETHANKASRSGPKASNPATPFQLMPEYSYGIWHNWEFSLQLPVSAQQDRVRFDGYRVELQYVAPHDVDQGFYWGMNFELANLEREGEPRIWIVEFAPIIGWRVDRWHLAANPGVNRLLTGAARKTNFEPAAKVTYRAFGQNYYGVEYYMEAGPIQHWLPDNRQSKVLYLAWDGRIGKSDINVGIGRGLTDGSDRWVIKTIFEIAF